MELLSHNTASWPNSEPSFVIILGGFSFRGARHHITYINALNMCKAQQAVLVRDSFVKKWPYTEHTCMVSIGSLYIYNVVTSVCSVI